MADKPAWGADLSESSPTPVHSVFEDCQGLVFGTAMIAVGAGLLQHLGLVTGQIAGLSLLITHSTGYGFGLVFFLLNLPFYWFAIQRMGWVFTLKTFAAVVLVSVFSMVQPHLITFGDVNPLAGAVVAGMVISSGFVAVFRHGASIGGVGILALYVQTKTGFRAGWLQMLADLIVFSLAALTLPPLTVLFSLIGAAVINVIIAVNHRRDHYIAT